MCVKEEMHTGDEGRGGETETKRKTARQRETETGGNALSYLSPWVSWVCFHSTHVLIVNPACFLRYLEWVSVHIRKPTINGWIGRNCILNILGHQPACLNLEWQAMGSHWVFLTEKRGGLGRGR